MPDAKTKWSVILAGRKIIQDAPRRIAIHEGAIQTLMQGASIAEEVTVPGKFLADLCQALVASMPGDVQACHHCPNPYFGTTRGDNGERVFACSACLHGRTIMLWDEVAALKEKLRNANAEIERLIDLNDARASMVDARVAAARCETCVRLDRLAPCVECPEREAALQTHAAMLRDASPLGRLISRMDDAGMTATGAVAECPACDGTGDSYVDHGFDTVECRTCDGTGHAKGGE